MCGCGKTRTQVVTSVNAVQEAEERRLAAETMYDRATDSIITGAEQLARSAGNAIGNSRS